MTLTDWNNFLRAYRVKHPGLTYKQAQKLAANEYRVRGVYGTGVCHSKSGVKRISNEDIGDDQEECAMRRNEDPISSSPVVNEDGIPDVESFDDVVDQSDVMVHHHDPNNPFIKEFFGEVPNTVSGSGVTRPELIYYPEIHGAGYTEFRHKPDWYKPVRVSRSYVQGSGGCFSTEVKPVTPSVKKQRKNQPKIVCLNDNDMEKLNSLKEPSSQGCIYSEYELKVNSPVKYFT